MTSISSFEPTKLIYQKILSIRSSASSSNLTDFIRNDAGNPRARYGHTACPGGPVLPNSQTKRSQKAAWLCVSSFYVS